MIKNHRKIRVSVADDHPVVREGLCSLVKRQDVMKVVAEATTGREAFEQSLGHKPRVALIDLRMPEMSGIEVIEAGAFDLLAPPYGERLLVSVVERAAASRQASQWQTATQFTTKAELPGEDTRMVDKDTA